MLSLFKGQHPFIFFIVQKQINNLRLIIIFYRKMRTNSEIYTMKLLVTLMLLTLTTSNIQSRLQFPQYCLYHGYPTQIHTIRTKDTYSLRFFRLQAKNSEIQPRKKVVYLQHGLQDSSDTWIVNNQSLAPAFILANRGYDVWVGNTRGNVYSSPLINTKIKAFWDFSFDQMAKYDLPAAFQYINNITDKKIHYIGHSQGTMIMFAALADKINSVKARLASYIALGPVAYLDNQQSRLLGSLAHTSMIKILNSSHVKQIFYSKQSTRMAVAILCVYDPILCTTGLKQISQKNNTVNNIKRLPVVMGHFPSGSSLRNMDHFQQIIRKGKFAKYDFGPAINTLKYGTKQPPIYNLTNIDFPVHLFVGQYDRLADVKDAQRLSKELGSKIKDMTLLKFGHATFMWGKDSSYMQQVIKIIQSSS